MRSILRPASLVGFCLVVGLLFWACQDTATSPVTPDEGTQPAFGVGEHDGNGHKKPVLRMTGGGRIDYPPGGPEKNTPENQDFQTFGFNVGDKDGDGNPEGEWQHVDHRRDMRRDGSPLNLHSVSWDSFRTIESECEGGGGDGSAEATGTLVVKNDGERYPFRLELHDCGEPGTKAPRDIYEVEAPGYFVRGVLTGGNIQAHLRR